MDSNVRFLKRSREFIDKYSPPILDNDHTDWISSYEMGHIGYAEDMFPIEGLPGLLYIKNSFYIDKIRLKAL